MWAPPRPRQSPGGGDGQARRLPGQGRCPPGATAQTRDQPHRRGCNTVKLTPQISYRKEAQRRRNVGSTIVKMGVPVTATAGTPKPSSRRVAVFSLDNTPMGGGPAALHSRRFPPGLRLTHPSARVVSTATPGRSDCQSRAPRTCPRRALQLSQEAECATRRPWLPEGLNCILTYRGDRRPEKWCLQEGKHLLH